MSQPPSIRTALFRWLRHVRSHRPRRHAPHRWRRRRTVAALVLLAIVALVVLVRHYTGDERIRRQAIEALSAVTGGEIEISAARLLPLRGIRIEGLRAYLPHRPHAPENLFFQAQDVLLELAPTALLRPRLHIGRIVVSRATLYVRYDPARNDLNLRYLDFLDIQRPEAAPPPTIMLREAAVEYQEVGNGQPGGAMRQVVSGILRPDAADLGQYLFELHAQGEGVFMYTSLTGSYDLETGVIVSDADFDLQALNFAQLPLRAQQWQELYKVSRPAGRITTTTRYDPDGASSLRLRLENVSLDIPLAEDANLPLRRVTADIECRPQEVHIHSIDGWYDDQARFAVAGRLGGYSRAAAFALSLQMTNFELPELLWRDHAPSCPLTPAAPGAPVPANLSGLQALLGLVPDEVLAQFIHYQPAGSFDADIDLRRDGEQSAPLAVKGVVHCRGVSFCYSGFPYPILNVHGPIVFDNTHIYFGPLEARMGAQEMTLRGAWAPSAAGPARDFTVHTRNMPLDQQLYEAFPRPLQAVWEEFEPSGVIDAVYRRHTPPGSPPDQPARETLAVRLHNVACRYQAIPVPITAMNGHIWLTPDARVAFEVNEARALDGDVTLAGIVENIWRGPLRWDCDVDFHDVRVGAELAEALPADLAELFAAAGAEGRADGRLHISAADQEEPAFRVQAHLRDGRVRYRDFPYPLDEVDALVTIDRQDLLIRSLRGRHDDGEVLVRGRVSRAGAADLHLQTRNLPLNAELARNLPPDAQGLWARFQPTGVVDLRARFRSRDQQPWSYHAHAAWRDGVAQPPELNYPFVNITAALALQPGRIVIHELISRQAPTTLSLSGDIVTAGVSATNDAAYRLNVKLDQLPLDHETRAAFPANLQALLNQVDLRGEADLDFIVDHRPASDGDSAGAWEFQGRLDLRNAAVAYPFAAEQMNLRLEGAAYYDAQEPLFNLAAWLAPSQMIFDDKPLDNMTARVNYDGREKRLDITDITADFCQGRLAAQLRGAVVGANVPHQLDLTLMDVSLEQYLGLTTELEPAPGSLRGNVSGRISLQQPLPPEPRQGAFTFAVRDAALGRLPLLSRLMAVLNLTIPADEAFTAADIDGVVLAQDLIFNEIRLRSDVVNLTGKGRLIMPDDTLALAFAADAPPLLAGVPLLGSFIEAFINPALMQVRVSGSFADPRVEAVAFPSLDEAVRSLTIPR